MTKNLQYFSVISTVSTDSTVIGSQSNRASLGCGGTEEVLPGCTFNKSVATVGFYHVKTNQNLNRLFSTVKQ